MIERGRRRGRRRGRGRERGTGRGRRGRAHARVPALISCQDKETIILAYNNICILSLLPPDPALEGSEAETHAGC